MTGSEDTAPIWTVRSTDADAITFRITPGSAKTLGRGARVDFLVEAPLVSRVHCRFSSDARGQLTVADLGSTNGTFVNDRRIDQAIVVAGDRIRIGRLEFMATLGASGPIDANRSDD